MRIILTLLTLSLIFLLVISNTQQTPQVNRIDKLKKLEPKLRELTSSQEKVRVIVWLEKDSDLKNFRSIGKVRYDYSIIPAIAMEVPSNRLEDLAELSDVKKVVLDRKVTILRMDSIPLIKADVASNDFVVNGTNINVSIIDTGIFNHTEFQTPNRIVKQKCYCQECCPPNNLNESDNATDDHSHGTHCAGITGGEGDGSGRGVATNVSLFAVKVLDSSGSGYDSDVAAGIDWSVNNGANVISMSLGEPYYEFMDCYDLACSEAVDNATKQGVVVVVAAGNDGSFAETIAAPGCAKSAITVGNTNDNDVIYSSSSRGPTKDNRTKPDLTAPGVSIYSTINSLNGYDYKTGTSMSTPHVAGVAALLMQKFYQTFGYLPEPDRVKAIILTAVNISGMNSVGYQQRNNVHGSGRIDAYETLSIMNLTRNNTISQNQTHRYNLNVTGNLKLTLYWPEDKDTNNNLNLFVGNRSYNYSYQTDANDVIEQVFLYNPKQRIWKVYVEGVNGLNQDYYLASNMEIIDDVTPPVLILIKPENVTYNTQSGIPLNFITDNSNQTIWYTVDDVNETIVTGNTTFNVSSDGYHNITLYVNDSYDNINQSVQYFSVDTTPPKSSDNSTSTRGAGLAVGFRLRWLDSVALDSYIFSMDNCTGSFVNLTESTFPDGIEDWSNVTHVINDTIGCTIRWRVYANDTSNYWNSSLEYSFVTIDGTFPRWSNNKTSLSSPTYSPDQTYQFNVTWVDNIALDTVLIEHNFTVPKQNDSFSGNISSEYYFNVSNLKAGTYLWRSFANDTTGNVNMTDQWTYVINKIPIEIALYLNGTRGNVFYEPNQTANFTVTLNVYGRYVNLTTNISGWVDLTNVTPLMNYTKLTTEGVYNITGYWLGDDNYTSDSETWYATVTITTTTTSTTTTTLNGGGGAPTSGLKTATEDVTLSNSDVLKDDTTLQSRIEDLLDKDLDSQSIDDLINNSDSIKSDLEVTREFIGKHDLSALTISIKYNGDTKAINFIFYDILSKNFSQSSDNISVTASGSTWRVVEKDPSFVFLYSGLSDGDDMDIEYEIDEGVDPSVINETLTYVFVEGFEIVETTTTTTITIPSETVCGDGDCQSGENCGNCSEDCPCAEGYECKNNLCIFVEKSAFNWIYFTIPVIMIGAGIGGWFAFNYLKKGDEFEKLKDKWVIGKEDYNKLKEKWTSKAE